MQAVFDVCSHLLAIEMEQIRVVVIAFVYLECK